MSSKFTVHGCVIKFIWLTTLVPFTFPLTDPRRSASWPLSTAGVICLPSASNCSALKVQSKHRKSTVTLTVSLNLLLSYPLLIQAKALDILAGKVRLTVSDLLSVPLLALSPSLVGPVGRSTLWDDFASDSAPASALHGASPSAPTHNTKSTRLVVTVLSNPMIGSGKQFLLY